MKSLPQNHPAIAWIRGHRDLVLTLASGVVAFAVTATFAPAPVSLMGIALVACLLVPYQTGASKRTGAIFSWLPPFGAIAVTAVAARFFFGESWAGMAFVPAWLGLLALLKLGFSPDLAGFWKKTADGSRAFIDFANGYSLTLGLGAAVLLWLAHRCDPNAFPDVWIFAWGAIGWLVLERLPLLRWPEQPSIGKRLLAIGVRYAVWATVVALFAGPGACGWLADIASVFFLYVLLVSIRRIDLPENLRWVIVAGYSFALMFPVAMPNLAQGGDSTWYGLTMADVLSQFHAGVFPIFIGQSLFQFNGSYSPLRLAPLFHHLGILTDLLTGCRLSPTVVQNLIVIGCGVGTGVSAYAALRDLLSAHRWMALLLSCLFVASPSVLAMNYDQHLYMTWMAMPWIPLVLLAYVQTFENRGFRPYLLLAVSLGMVWWAHSPIALWLTGMLFLGQLVRLWRGPVATDARGPSPSPRPAYSFW